ncbi:DUF3658 domain-containing protein [Gemmiger sp.]
MMIQLCFDDSAKGMLKCAVGYETVRGAAVGVCISPKQPLDAPWKRAAFAVYRFFAAPFYKRRVRNDTARRVAEAVPVDYQAADVLALPAGLNEGDISGPLDGPARREYAERLIQANPYGGADIPQAEVGRYWQSVIDDLHTLLTRAGSGEPVRIWYDHTPGCLCGLYAAAALLESLPCAVTVIELPAEGAARVNDLGPDKVGRCLSHERPLPDDERHALAARWRELQAENAPLRAEIVLLPDEADARLHSVPADFYDDAILAQVSAAPTPAGRIIGNVLLHGGLGIGDQLVYKRLQAMISTGKVTLVEKGDGAYMDLMKR